MNDYSGFTIRYAVLDGNMFNEDTESIDVEASCGKYVEMVTAKIQAEYPEVIVDMPIQENTSGYNREASVDGPDADSFEEE